ncbi:MAG TPA: Txe/YoeB family addiction module toxin [Thermomicrobiales bacterium]|nr:Txe/YoeB family addiction module toxin [Thermomicrobiales bacterium]
MTRKGRTRRGAGGPAPQAERLAVFQPEFREDLRWWTRERPRIAERIWSLVEECLRAPFEGIGKPEPLRHLGPDVWSRRVTQEHRLVYLVRADRVDFLQCRYHY